MRAVSWHRSLPGLPGLWISLALGACMLLAASCTGVESCETPENSIAAAWFVSLEDGEPVKVALSGMSLRALGREQDLLIMDTTDAARLVLPLDPHHPSTSFVLDLDSIADTLTIWHRQEIYLESTVCGFRYRFRLDSASVSGGILLSAQLKNESVDATFENTDEDLWLWL